MGKRQLMNLFFLGAISPSTAGMLVPYAYFFAPTTRSGGAGGGQEDLYLPWNAIENKFICLCPGSQYNSQISTKDLHSSVLDEDKASSVPFEVIWRFLSLDVVPKRYRPSAQVLPWSLAS
ncbi:cytochrome b6-f complex iron-sulfur subunit 2, chloroplastic-like [Olea europaea var. sylvestris]|uniref:cytochrome b6-f complex iron-sulfur subunit 2, chloroplastic-like n=1 Tax=Olea europaea var. sylvestris TaxID=158386 RepID=UPI000C1D6664|nr:cytochrome b6-f complex iron-sulfur subunit 2, chloroplastic-like [Olea europaea var. sylvestris]